MPTLYNCRHSGDQYRISKFDQHFNLESSYLCTLAECECPAGHRPMCRHRDMLPKFMLRNYVGTEFFFDYDRGGWVQGAVVIEDEIPPEYAQEAIEAEKEWQVEAIASEASVTPSPASLSPPTPFRRRI